MLALNKVLRNILILGLLFSSIYSNKIEASSNHGLTLLSARFSGIAVYQRGGGAYSGVVNWIPSYFFNDTFGLRASVGGTALKDKVGSLKLVLEYQLLATLVLSKTLAIEAGGGRQNFLGNGGNRWVVSANVAHVSEKPFFLFFDHIFVGYTAAFIPTLYTHEFRAGLGIGF